MIKVKASAEAALFLHSEAACAQGNVTRANAARAFFAEQQAHNAKATKAGVDEGGGQHEAGGNGQTDVQRIDATDPDALLKFVHCMRNNLPALIRGVTQVRKKAGVSAILLLTRI